MALYHSTLLLILFLGSFVSTSPIPPSTKPTIKTAPMNIITQAIQQAVYTAQNAFDIASRLNKTTVNVTFTCFIEPRYPNNNDTALTLLKQDRIWLNDFYNYTKLVYDAECSDLKEKVGSDMRICIDMKDSISFMSKLKDLLDQIIRKLASPDDDNGAGSGESSGEMLDPREDETHCWDITAGQQYWNFNTLGEFMDLYVRDDLKKLAQK